MLDQTAIQTYFGGDTSLLRKFAGIFVQEAPNLVNLMDEALASGDLPALAIHAHTLKSQIRYFGYSDLTNRLQDIEQQADAQTSPEVLAPLLRAFNQDFREAYQAVAALRGEQ
jgi:HPt (histidine-containing phosphotransfer) domain-containing protein